MIIIEISTISTLDALLRVWDLKKEIADLQWAMHHELENGHTLRSMRIQFDSEEQAMLFLIKHGDIARIVDKELT